MSRAKGDKGQGRRAKGPARGKKARARAKPGILESWENFDKAAMAEYMAAVEEDFAHQLDELEQALRSEN
jgi:hypothetical protein